jgi:hypothetical protein
VTRTAKTRAPAFRGAAGPAARRRALRRYGGAALLLAVVLCALAGWGSPAWWALPAVAVAVTLTELAVVHLQHGGRRWTFSSTEAAVGAALALSAGAWLVPVVALGVAAARWLRSQPRPKAEYDVAQVAASTAAAALGAGLVGGGPLGAAVGMGLFWLVGHLMGAAAVTLSSTRHFRSLVVSGSAFSVLHTAAACSVGLLGAHLAVEAPLGLLGLAVPVTLLWTSYDQQNRRSAEVGLFSELARGQERAATRSTDVSAQVVLTAAARIAGGADVEMVLLAPDGPVRYTGDENGVPHRYRVDPDALDEPWVLRALGAGGVAVGEESGRPWVSAVLGPAGAPLAILVARRPRGASSFGRREARLVGVLARQAESWLAEAGAGSGLRPRPASVPADPARALLRESADRLVRLAETQGPVDPIVEELHHVERAVASLLGSVALDPAAGTDPVPRPHADWTTTGVLR